MNWVHPKLIISALGAVALLWPSTAESPIGAAGPASHSAVSAASDPVQVEYEIIHVPDRIRKSPRPQVSSTAVRLASASKPPRHRKPDGLVVRAGRMLVGDGRYRPEPFPRPGR